MALNGTSHSTAAKINQDHTTNHSVHDVAAEVQDRLRCLNNLIFYNVSVEEAVSDHEKVKQYTT